MGANFRRFLVIMMIAVWGLVYFKTHYHLSGLVGYLKDHPKSIIAGPTADYSISMAYFMRGKYEPAAEMFTQLLTDYPTSQYTESALLHLGESYEAVRSWAKAREAYQLYIEQFPHGKNITVVQSSYEHIKFN